MKWYDKLVVIFTTISLFCPLLWYGVNLQEKYFSVSFFELGFVEQIILSSLTIMPIYSISVIFKNWS
jgi:hypothetical protein